MNELSYFHKPYRDDALDATFRSHERNIAIVAQKQYRVETA